MWQSYINDIRAANFKALARAISLVENEVPNHEQLLEQLPNASTPVIGITGPPGAGKSTLVDAMIALWVAQDKKIAILCIDPSSPFHFGALLGDRIRMSDWYTHPNIFIRSLATRGALGGLHPNIIEITALLQAASFDYIIVETVGVGQSEIEIAGLADLTLVVLVPESGDEVQNMKAGLMEVADIFVINKSDRPDADLFLRNLRLMLMNDQHPSKERMILKTVASKREGIEELCALIENNQCDSQISAKKIWLQTERVYQMIQKKKMRTINKENIKMAITQQCNLPDFNLFKLAKKIYDAS